MAVTVANFQEYESGSGGYTNVHTYPDVDASGTNPYVVGTAIPRVNTWVDSFTIEGNTATAIASNISGDSTCGIDVRGYLNNAAASTVVVGTSSYKLNAGHAVAFNGVDQTTPVVGTPVTAGAYNESPYAACVSYTHLTLPTIYSV